MDTIRTPEQIDAELANKTDTQLEALAKNTDRPASKDTSTLRGWGDYRLSDENRVAMRASNMLSARKRAAELDKAKQAKEQADQQAAAVRFDAEKQAFFARIAAGLAGADDKSIQATAERLWQDELAARAKASYTRMVDSLKASMIGLEL